MQIKSSAKALFRVRFAAVVFASITAVATSEAQPTLSAPDALRNAINQDYDELSIKLPESLHQALSQGRRLDAEEIHRQLDGEKQRILSKLDVQVLYDYSHLPLLLVRPVTANQRAVALLHPRVESLQPARFFRTSLSATDSSAQIGAGIMRQLGFNGTGASVLVTDTGINVQNIHPDFGACAGIGTPTNTCKLASYSDLGNNWDLSDGSSHGANVSGIIALTAPEARIHHVNIDCGSGDNPNCVSGALGMQGLNWAIQNQAQYNIVAHNMSWGSDNSCTYQAVMNAGTVAGITQIAASGNEGFTDRIISPANCSGVFSVGRLNTAFGTWMIAPSSNVVASLDFLAPGESIDAAGTFNYSGTSMAAPHVTGATAILQASNQWSGLSSPKIEQVMKWSGTPFLDERVGVTFPLINVYAARMLEIRVSNPDGVSLNLSPSPLRECGTNCFNYPETTVTATHPAGYLITGCRRITSTSCTIEIRRSGTHRVLRRVALANIIAILNQPLQPAPVFRDGFE